MGCGDSPLPCTVKVVDADGNAVTSATVHLRDARDSWDGIGGPECPIPQSETFASGVTDASGTVTIAFSFRVNVRTAPYRDDEGLVWIDPDYWVQVDAPGYERAFVRLEGVLGRKYDWNKLPLPPVTVELSESRVP